MRTLAAAIAASLVLAAWFWQSNVRQRLVTAAPTLPVHFAHADHRNENCVGCHHNFADHTGDGLCFDCHERSAEVGHLLEAQFHDMCRGCHLQRQAQGLEHGPTRHCRQCHVTDPFP